MIYLFKSDDNSMKIFHHHRTKQTLKTLFSNNKTLVKMLLKNFPTLKNNEYKFENSFKKLRE